MRCVHFFTHESEIFHSGQMRLQVRLDWLLGLMARCIQNGCSPSSLTIAILTQCMNQLSLIKQRKVILLEINP